MTPLEDHPRSSLLAIDASFVSRLNRFQSKQDPPLAAYLDTHISVRPEIACSRKMHLTIFVMKQCDKLWKGPYILNNEVNGFI